MLYCKGLIRQVFGLSSSNIGQSQENTAERFFLSAYTPPINGGKTYYRQHLTRIKNTNRRYCAPLTTKIGSGAAKPHNTAPTSRYVLANTDIFCKTHPGWLDQLSSIVIGNRGFPPLGTHCLGATQKIPLTATIA